MAREHPDPLQPGLGRPLGQALERAEEADLVGRRPEEVGRERCAGLPAHGGTRCAAGQGGAVQGPVGHRCVHHEPARRRAVLHGGRRRPLPRALRAVRVTDPEPALQGPVEPGGQGLRRR